MKTATMLFCVALGAVTTSAAERPNIVFILADDLGWRDLSGEGSTFYESPHIDRIAAQGHAVHPGLRRLPGVQPLAGQHHDGQVSGTPRHHRLDRRGDGRGMAQGAARYEAAAARLRSATCRQTRSRWPRRFAQAGYPTFFAGKWHLGDDGSIRRITASRSTEGGWRRRQPIGRLLLALQESEAGRRSRGRIAAPAPGRRNGNVHRAAQGRTVPRVPDLLLRPRTDSDQPRSFGQSTARRPSTPGPPNDSLPDRSHDARPASAGQPDLRRA